MAFFNTENMIQQRPRMPMKFLLIAARLTPPKERRDKWQRFCKEIHAETHEFEVNFLEYNGTSTSQQACWKVTIDGDLYVIDYEKFFAAQYKILVSGHMLVKGSLALEDDRNPFQRIKSVGLQCVQLSNAVISLKPVHVRDFFKEVKTVRASKSRIVINGDEDTTGIDRIVQLFPALTHFDWTFHPDDVLLGHNVVENFVTTVSGCDDIFLKNVPRCFEYKALQKLCKIQHTVTIKVSYMDDVLDDAVKKEIRKSIHNLDMLQHRIHITYNGIEKDTEEDLVKQSRGQDPYV